MLTPLFIIDEDVEQAEVEVTEEDLPSKTYLLDIKTGEIYPEFVDNEDAIRQAAVKAIMTRRDRYAIYTSDYGCEIQYLIGTTYSKEYLDLEVPRLINECLSVDKRISGTSDYMIENSGNELYVTFKIQTNDGDTIDVEVEI